MKRYLNYISNFMVLLFLWQQSYGSVTATSTMIYTSVNPKIHYGATQRDMMQLSVTNIMQLGYRMQEEGGILANAAGGEVRIKVYYYRADAIDGKRMLLYENSSSGNSPDYVTNATSYNYSSWHYPVDPVDGTFWYTGRQPWGSYDIKSAALEAVKDHREHYGCWQNWNTNDCGYSRGLSEQVIPIIIEVTIHHATLTTFKIPGLPEVFNPALLAVIQPTGIKGSNYEITDLKSNTSFGHANNRYTIKDVNPEFSSKKITGLFDDDIVEPNSYFKMTPTGGTIFIAIENGGNLNHLPEFHDYYPSLYKANAFKIEKGGVAKSFDVFKVTPLNNLILKTSANASGPFIIADNFDVSFKEDLALPVAKRKLFHRENWLNDILVCAHRGTWGKVGSHNPVDYSGIAENTIPAYELAINNPDIDWIEFDGRRTSDGVFVAWHDEGISRVSSFPDDQECIPVDEVNARDKVWRDEHRPTYAPGNLLLKNKTWNTIKDLHLRDYLGCKVKDASGNYMHPLKLEDGFKWLRDQKALGKHSVISVDYKDGLKYLDEVYRLILKYDLEGQILLSVYAKEYSLADYQAEYGHDFLKQIPLKPTFYEPVNLATDYGGNVLNRFNEYINAPEHFVAGFTLNVNYDKDDLLIGVLEQPAFPSIANRVWYMSHYNEPFMASISDNNRVNSTVDCDPRLHPILQLCSNLFWRADFDWLLNNGTNAIFSDNTESLIEYLKAKGKK